MLTQERVKELFDYKEGILVRKVDAGGQRNSGKISGCLSRLGYVITKVDGKAYKNHRLIWLYHYGYMPEHDLDHLDRDRSNNKIDNLREVSRTCNSRNRGNSVCNKSGIKGVYWNSKTKKWRAHISIKRKIMDLGGHDCLVEAAAHRLAAEQCLDWNDCDCSSIAFKYMKKYIDESNDR